MPKDFGDKRLTWTIIANGKTTSMPVGVIKDYQIEPFKEPAREPAADAQVHSNRDNLRPPADRDPQTLTGAVGQPVTLDVTVTDECAEQGESPAFAGRSPPLALSWHKHRGPGDVKFSEARPKTPTTARRQRPRPSRRRANTSCARRSTTTG